ncbi:site-specific integrase [Vibrio aestuarianus]|uniref:Phage_integrase domain-containing protein n=2 Tax=Vibrio aestuarianus TaxID=28171 RepID=A0ABM9FL42_9VIBR|nr:site-specific integrase [Vibrio aestuarianus]MDE1227208.1 site-specific integrase [Vibrio aestuarianus]MDE1255292.1 site-specific integrase [Vibrio aestuarianus]MDE1270100.1 site-specific integrase [Vibrio aestuarianus]NLS56654.1 site-specific integrase [Vibrio aestuarianus subsp. francensis]WDS53307.1 site-specific integrase [Vibrio aestuarianus]
MYESLTKGLAIYRQNHTKSIYVRLRVKGKELKRSLKTTDVEEAKAKAWGLKFEIEGMVKAGLEIEVTQKKSVRDACLTIIKNLESKKPFKAIYKDYILVYKNFIIPHFLKKTIEDLTTKNIRIYFESLENLSKTRKTINKICFKKLFEYLEEEDLLKKKDFPSLPTEISHEKTEIGIDINKNDLEIIREFINSDDFQNQENINFKTKEYRQIFPFVFEFLFETGIRTGKELNNIQIKNLSKVDDHFFVKILGGKTSYKKRDVILSDKAINSIIEVLKITTNKNITKDNILSLNKEKFVFASSFFTKKKDVVICDFCKLFDQIIKRLIKENKINTKYTLYSLRHTYITLQLLNGVRMYLVSKQVGNSLEMIEKHYDHVMLKDSKNRNELLGINEFDLLNKEYFKIEQERFNSLTDEEKELERITNRSNLSQEDFYNVSDEEWKKLGR